MLAEMTLRGFRVFAAAVPVPFSSGFRAATSVLRTNEDGLPIEVVFTDPALEDGQIWPGPTGAVQFALQVAEAAVKNHERLAGAHAEDAS